MKEDVFDHRLARPMLLVDGKPFDSKDYLYELKLDGVRALAYLDSQTEIRNKRNKNVTSIYPELQLMHQQVKKRCILDGELIVAVNGMPDFFEIQRRSLMTDSFKIELLSKSKPVSFVAYDVLYLGDRELIDLPLIDRKRILSDTVTENQLIAISRYVEEKGIDFYQIAASKNLEGVVAKKKTSLYYYGKRTKDWEKFKKMYDEDFVVCGYEKDEETGGIRSIVIGGYKGKDLLYQGHVALGISKEDERIIMNYAKEHPSHHPFSVDTDTNVVWMRIGLVCTVKYMMRTHTNSLRQPVFKGLRNDKEPLECQLNITE